MKHIVQILTTVVFCILLTSCGGSFEPIAWGKDACAHCRMTIMDQRFAAELVDDKGKVFKYDDLRCAREHMAENNKKGGALYVADFAAPGGDFVRTDQARFVQHASITSPMGGGTIAFASEDAAKKMADSLGVSVVEWNSVKE